jgi:hypothetical protein
MSREHRKNNIHEPCCSWILPSGAKGYPFCKDILLGKLEGWESSLAEYQIKATDLQGLVAILYGPVESNFSADMR